MTMLDDTDWPVYGLTSDVRPALRRAVATKRDCVLVTLTGLEGSSPRAPGAQMLFDGDEASGALSGGCIEADVACHAAATLADAAPRNLVYGRGSPWLDIRLACGGRMELLVERLGHDEAAVAELLRLTDARRVALWSSNGRERRVVAASETQQSAPAARGYGMIYNPRWRLVLVGGGAVVLALGRLGAQADFEVIVARPRGPVRAPPIPGAAYVREDVEKALGALNIDAWTAIVSLTHDDDLDDLVAALALAARAGYVGVMGATQRARARLDRLRAQGLAEDALARLASPAGAAPCGKSPWEVAVSIMAQVMVARSAAGGIATLTR